MDLYPKLTMSKEAELDQQIEVLIAKMVAGEASHEDMLVYRELSRRRAALLQPSIYPRPDRRRAKVA